MDDTPSPPLSGRRAQAARNDRLILAAARDIFLADPEAPIAAVADRAGVGISAIYGRYHSKADLLHRLNADGLADYIATTEAALASDGDPWTVFADFMRRVVDADTHSMALRLAGTFAPNERLWRDGQRAHELTRELVDRTKAAGVLRADIDVNDLAVLFEQLATIRVGDRSRTDQLRRRGLALMLDALRAPASAPLPGPPPTWEEISGRFHPDGRRRTADRHADQRAARSGASGFDAPPHAS